MGPPWSAVDGMPILSPPGQLEVDVDEDRVRCHLCGDWWRSLGSHLYQRHGLSAEEYRKQMGLHPCQSLAAPSINARRAELMKRRLASDERVQAGIKRAHRLARSGELQARAREVAKERGLRQARLEQLKRGGKALGERRANAFRARRESHAQALGFATLEDCLRVLYVERGARIEDLQRKLGASYSAIRGDLRRAGIEVLRGRRSKDRA